MNKYTKKKSKHRIINNWFRIFFVLLFFLKMPDAWRYTFGLKSVPITKEGITGLDDLDDRWTDQVTSFGIAATAANYKVEFIHLDRSLPKTMKSTDSAKALLVVIRNGLYYIQQHLKQPKHNKSHDTKEILGSNKTIQKTPLTSTSTSTQQLDSNKIDKKIMAPKTESAPPQINNGGMSEDERLLMAEARLHTEFSDVQWRRKRLFLRRILKFGSVAVRQPNFLAGQRTILAWETEETKQLGEFRKQIKSLFCESKHNTMPPLEIVHDEMHYYFRHEQCGVGFHVNIEHTLLISLSLGHSMPLHWQWYMENTPIKNSMATISLEHGDVCIFTAKAIGKDAIDTYRPTLRHAIGREEIAKWPDPGLRSVCTNNGIVNMLTHAHGGSGERSSINLSNPIITTNNNNKQTHKKKRKSTTTTTTTTCVPYIAKKSKP